MLQLLEEGFTGAQAQVRVQPARRLQRIQIPTVVPCSLRLDLLQLRILRRRQAPVSKQTPPLKFWLRHTAVVPRSLRLHMLQLAHCVGWQRPVTMQLQTCHSRDGLVGGAGVFNLQRWYLGACA